MYIKPIHELKCATRRRRSCCTSSTYCAYKTWRTEGRLERRGWLCNGEKSNGTMKQSKILELFVESLSVPNKSQRIFVNWNCNYIFDFPQFLHRPHAYWLFHTTPHSAHHHHHYLPCVLHANQHMLYMYIYDLADESASRFQFKFNLLPVHPPVYSLYRRSERPCSAHEHSVVLMAAGAINFAQRFEYGPAPLPLTPQRHTATHAHHAYAFAEQITCCWWRSYAWLRLHFMHRQTVCARARDRK